jgi:hypothetical protein
LHTEELPHHIFALLGEKKAIHTTTNIWVKNNIANTTKPTPPRFAPSANLAASDSKSMLELLSRAQKAAHTLAWQEVNQKNATLFPAEAKFRGGIQGF